MNYAMWALEGAAAGLVSYVFIDAGKRLWSGYTSIRDQYEKEEQDYRDAVDTIRDHK